MLNFNSWVFDNKSSEEFGLLHCTFDKPSGVSDGGDMSEIQFNLSSNLINGRWAKNGNSTYNGQPKYEITAMFNDFRNMDSYDIDAIRRWLCRKDGFHKFSIVKGDHFDLHFEVQIPSVQTQIVNGEIVGIKFSILCNSPNGFSHKVKFSADSSKVGTITIPDLSDEMGYIYPDVRIEMIDSGDISITNSREPSRPFVLRNCKAGEIITIKGSTQQIETSLDYHKIYNDYNFNAIRVINDSNSRKNVYSLSGHFYLNIEYTPLRKVTI